MKSEEFRGSGFRVQGPGFRVQGLTVRPRLSPARNFEPQAADEQWSMVTKNHSTDICGGNEAGSYLRLTDSFITQLEAQGPSGTCHESQEEEKGFDRASEAVSREELRSPGRRRAVKHRRVCPRTRLGDVLQRARIGFRVEDMNRVKG